MKILLFAEEYPPHGSGVASSAHRIGQGLAQMGHDVMVMTYDRLPIDGLDPRADLSTDGLVRVLRVGPYMRFPKRKKAPKLNESTKAILRRRLIETAEWTLRDLDFKPELIISLYLTDAGYISCFLAKKFGCLHVAGVRGNDLGLNLFDPPKLPLTSFVIERADAIAYVNSFLRQLGTQTFPQTAERSFLTPNSIKKVPQANGQTRKDLLEQTGWSDDDRIFAYVGLFREKKGCVEIVDAFERIHANDPDNRAKLLMISPALSPLERDAIGERLKKLQDEGRAVQISEIPRSQVIEHLTGADFLLMPSRNDGMANALLEGMACGLCPIVSHIFAEVVDDGENGLMIDAVTGKEVERAIRWGVANDEAAKRMGAAARDKVNYRSPADEAEDYISIYRELCRRNGRKDRSRDREEAAWHEDMRKVS
jgi:glycosyltransferase involved in cell wall biosynthesis